ncbi:MAG: hypothetical protein AB7K86_25335 [Rhodospirillales bacterium]
MRRIAYAVERGSRFVVLLMLALGLVGLAQQGADGLTHLMECLTVAGVAWIAAYGARSLQPAQAGKPKQSRRD